MAEKKTTGSKTPPRKPTAKPVAAAKPGRPARAKVDEPAKPDLAQVRQQIDGIDQQIQTLIAERARWAHQVGKAKGKLAAAVDYYRPEREAQVLRRVVDRNDGPLADEVLVRLFREVMALFTDGSLKALPYQPFAAEEVSDAFRLMQQSGHVGKIVIAPPKAGTIPAETTKSATASASCHAPSTRMPLPSSAKITVCGK